jgi:hypothetical protein
MVIEEPMVDSSFRERSGWLTGMCVGAWDVKDPGSFFFHMFFS